MKRLICSFFVVLLMGSLAPADQGKITGKVSDVSTGEPIYRANVELVTESGSSAAVTDIKGSFTFDTLTSGSYVIRVSFIGYRSVSRDVMVGGRGSRIRVDVDLALADLVGNEIVVSASRRPERLVDASVSISKVLSDEIQNNAAGFTYVSHLQRVKGIDYQQVGLFDERYNARGYNSAFNTRMLLLSDGRLTRTGAGNPLLNPVMAKDDLQEAEVIVGPGSALYGPDAIAGVVSLHSRDPRTSKGTTFGLAGGSRSIFKVSARHANFRGKWAWKLSGDYQRGNSWETVATYYTPDSLFSITDDPDFTSETLTSGGSLHFYPHPDAELRFGAGMTRVDQFFLNPVGRSQTQGYIHHYQQTTYQGHKFYFNVYHVGDDSGDSFGLDTRAFLELSGLSRNQAEDQARNSSDWSFWEAEVRVTQLLSDRVRLIAGGNYRLDKSTGSVLEGGAASARLVGGYGQLEKDISKWAKITLAARVDGHEIFNRQFSPKAALVIKPSRDHALRLTYNRAFRSPTLTQQRVLMSIQQGVTIRGNDDGFQFSSLFGVPLPASFAGGLSALKPEENNTFEAGFKGIMSERAFIDVCAHLSRYKNFISDPIPISDIRNGIAVVGPDGIPFQEETISFTNFGKQDVIGLDIGVHFFVTDQLTVRGNFSAIDADELKNGNGFTQPFNSPEAILNFGITGRDWLRDGTRVDANLKHVSAHDFVSGIHNGVVPAYTIVNLGLGYQGTKGFGYRLTARNVLNNKHREFVTGPEIGVVIVGQIEVGF